MCVTTNTQPLSRIKHFQSVSFERFAELLLSSISLSYISSLPPKRQHTSGDIIPKSLILLTLKEVLLVHPVLILSEKKDQWKCCIKPLIGVEHIRIILHAQSGSCYAAAYVVALAPEFSTLICTDGTCRACSVSSARKTRIQRDLRCGRHRGHSGRVAAALMMAKLHMLRRNPV